MEMEEKNRKTRKGIINLAIISAVFISVALILYLLSLNSSISEFFARYITRPFSNVMGAITGIFGFSVFEWSCFFAVVGFIVFIVLLIIEMVHHKWLESGHMVMVFVTVILCISSIYISTASVSYNRKPLPIDSIKNDEVTEQMVVDTYYKYRNDFENIISNLEVDDKNQSVCPYTFEEINQKLNEEYKRLDKEYFGHNNTRAKKINFSGIMSEFNIVGITFVPYGEANVNRMAPFTDIVVTMAHEMAHTKGVMRENDANLIAYYLLMTSEDNYLRYCGYLATYGIVYNAVVYANHKDILKGYPKVALEDKKREKLFWNQYDTFDKIGDFFNDLYLKLQGESGTDSYHEDNKGDWNENNQVYENVKYTDVQRMILKIYN